MKEQLIKKESEQDVVVYVSADGLEFTDQSACVDYEGNLFMVLKERIRRMAIKVTLASAVFDGEGSDDHDAFVLVPKSEQQVELIRTLLGIYNRYADEDCKKVQVRRPIVLLFNFDNSYAWVTDLDEMVQKATNGLFKVTRAE